MHLVELCGTDQYFAMKAMDKGVMLNRNKVLKYLDLHTSTFSLVHVKNSITFHFAPGK